MEALLKRRPVKFAFRQLEEEEESIRCGSSVDMSSQSKYYETACDGMYTSSCVTDTYFPW